MKKLIVILSILTLGVKSFGFPYKVNTANVNASEVTTSWTNFIWSMNAGSDQSFVFHTDQQGVTKVALRFGITAGSTNYPLEWQSMDISLTPTGSIFQGYLSRTSLPPDRTYYAEFAGFIGTNITDAGMSIGRGRINIQSSLFTDANYTTQIVYQSVSGRTNEIDPVYLSDKPSLTNLIEQAPFKWSSRPATQSVDFAQQYATNIGGIDFDATPIGSVGQYRMQWNSDRSTLDLGLSEDINLDVGQQLFLFAKSIETNTINKGEVVLVVGASGDNPTIKRASNASEALSSRTIGIAAQNISSNNNGFIVTAGTVYNINTSGFSQGAPLYLGANGTLQTNLPVAPLHGVFIGTVERVGENNGQIFIHVQNYQEVEELSDVNVRNKQVNDVLMWNGTVWTNASQSQVASGYVPLSGGTMSGNLDMGDNAITNVPILSYYGRAVELETGLIDGSGWYFMQQPTIPGYLTTNAAASLYATGSPVYVESDPVWTSASSLYYTIASADAKFATGAPVYSISGKLDSNVWSSADSTTNYARRSGETFTGVVTLNETGTGSLALNNALRMKHRSLTATELNTDIVATTGGLRRTTTGSSAATIWDSLNLADPIVNNQTNITLQGTFSGDGSGLTGLSASATNAVSTITLTSAVQDAVTFIGSGISQTGSTFNWNGYLPLSGGTMSGTINMNEEDITNVTSIVFETGLNSIGSGQFVGPLWTFSQQPTIPGYLTSTGAAAAYLSLAGGTLSGQLNLSTIKPAETAGGTEGYIDFAVDDEGVLKGPWRFDLQPTIPGYVNTNNLSNIAGSGLDVVANQLVVTNGGGAATFEELTGSRFVLGQGELSDITDSSQGSFISGIASNVNFGGLSHGSHVIGSFLGQVESGASSFGSSFVGSSPSTSTNKISPANLGNQQRGYFVGTASIGYNNLGQAFSGGSYGASQFGYLRGTATINGHGAMQIMGGVTPGEVYYSTGKGSLLLGPGTNAVDYSILANGPIKTLSGFEGNAANLTNFPSSLLTVSAGNTNYLRRTTVPASNTAFGQYNQFALDNTNLYIYNAASSKWLRINGTLEW